MAQIQFSGIQLKWSNSVKYLGVLIDEKLKFDKHIKNVLQKATGAKCSLFHLMNFRSPIPLRMRLYMYKTYIRPIIIYAGPAWSSNMSNSTWKKLEVFQMKILRMILGTHYYVSNKTILNSLQLETIQQIILTNTKQLIASIENSPFEHIKTIIHSKSPKEHYLKKPLNIT